MFRSWTTASPPPTPPPMHAAPAPPFPSTSTDTFTTVLAGLQICIDQLVAVVPNHPLVDLTTNQVQSIRNAHADSVRAEVAANAASVRAEVATQLQERDELLRERDAQIQEREARLRERDAQIQERDARLRERDAQIQERDARLREQLVEHGAAVTVLRANKEELARLVLHLEARQRAQQPEGSTTTAELYDRQEKGAPVPALLRHPPSITWERVRAAVRARYPDETSMYEPMVTLLNKILKHHRVGTFRHPVTAIDTHAHYFLQSKRKPDIIIQASPPYAKKPIPEMVVAVIQVKFPVGRVIAPADKGQVVDVLYKLMRAQPWRTLFTGLVTTLETNCWMQLHRLPLGRTYVTEVQGCTSFDKAMCYLVDQVLGDPNQVPDVPPFMRALGAVDSILGMTKSSLVAKFPRPLQSSNTDRDSLHVEDKDRDCYPSSAVAVKRVRRPGCSQEFEIDVLKKIKAWRLEESSSVPSPSLPDLICWDEVGKLEFGIAPVGERMSTEQLMERPHLALNVLHDVFDALTWLHRHGLIHRDVRWDNVIVCNGRGVLIDLAMAIEVPANTAALVPYLGGFICVPYRILQDPRPLAEVRYRPRIGDDYTAYILLLTTLLFPTSFRNLRVSSISNPLSPASVFLCYLWKRLRRAGFWGYYVGVAEKHQKLNNYAVLRGIASAVISLPLDDNLLGFGDEIELEEDYIETESQNESDESEESDAEEEFAEKLVRETTNIHSLHLSENIKTLPRT